MPLVIPPPSRRVVPVQWSEEQEIIFDYFQSGEGNAVFRARAGTGKTTTSKHGFSLAPERRMLYVVHNKKNQREAQEKIRNPRVETRTFHSLGLGIIFRHWSGVKPNDDVEFERLQKAVPNPDKTIIGPILKLVAFTKNICIAPTEADVREIADDKMAEEVLPIGFEKIILQILELSKQRDEQGRISFNDMVWLPCALGIVKPVYDLVLIDEAQDMNLPQLTIAKQVSKGRVIVVGDDRQCIYGFRGAVHDGLAMMQAELNAKAFGLTTTYRCPKKVVALAKEFVPDYNAASTAPDGIVDCITEAQLCDQVKVGDAILSRSNAPLMLVCLSLLRRNVPARIEGRDIGRQLLATVQKMKAKSVADFIGKVCKWAGRLKSRLLKKKNVESKIASIDDQSETLSAVAEGCKSVGEIEQRIRDLFQDSDESARPAVVLSTVHKAKGLEWKRVFLIRETFLKRRNREEENIYYVALTRAKEHLTFVGSESSPNGAQRDSATEHLPLMKQRGFNRKAASTKDIIG